LPLRGDYELGRHRSVSYTRWVTLECGGLTPRSNKQFHLFPKGDCCSGDWQRIDVASSRDEKKRHQAAALQRARTSCINLITGGLNGAHRRRNPPSSSHAFQI